MAFILYRIYSLSNSLSYFRDVNDNGRAKTFSGDASTLHGQGNSVYWCNGNVTNLPSGETYGTISTNICSGTLWYGSQTFRSITGSFYVRGFNGGVWGAWQKLATNNLYVFSLPGRGSCSFNVSSAEHAIFITVTGWANAVNGNLWFCTGYATGTQYKNIHKLSDSYQQIGLSATSTGYTLSNSTDSGCGVWVLSLNNQPVTQ